MPNYCPKTLIERFEEEIILRREKGYAQFKQGLCNTDDCGACPSILKSLIYFHVAMIIRSGILRRCIMIISLLQSYRSEFVKMAILKTEILKNPLTHKTRAP